MGARPRSATPTPRWIPVESSAAVRDKTMPGGPVRGGDARLRTCPRNGRPFRCGPVKQAARRLLRGRARQVLWGDRASQEPRLERRASGLSTRYANSPRAATGKVLSALKAKGPDIAARAFGVLLPALRF